MPNALDASLSTLTHVDVHLDGKKVGTIAQHPSRPTTLFEYDAAWIAGGFAISPYSLPLRPGVFEADARAQDGLFGVFRDSLPDDWGRLLRDRRLRELGVDATRLGPVAQLALVGSGGLGALEYSPTIAVDAGELPTDFDQVSAACQRLLENDEATALDGLYTYGSSSGGARPKVMVSLGGEPWIVKFPGVMDGKDAGAEEFRYAQLATSCGIEMLEVRLMPSNSCAGHFATKRFDRVRSAGGPVEKIHMISAAALLEASPFDALDYRNLMELALSLTGNAHDTEQLYRVMCFNVLAHNCDDHARNFSFLHVGEAWRLSPAYDLTRAEGFLGEHATLVNGKGSDISERDLMTVGAAGGISRRACREILERMRGVLRQK